jgi:hypothetical protein
MLFRREAMTAVRLNRAIAVLCAQTLAVAAWAVLPAEVQAQPAAGRAQEAAPPPSMSSITVVHVKPDMLLEWQKVQKEEVIPALKKAGVKQRNAWTTGVFGESFEYVFITPIESFAQYDGPGPLVRALGQDGAQALNGKLRQMIVSSRTIAQRPRPDLGHDTGMREPPPLVLLTHIQLPQGRGPDFENFIKTDWLPAVKKAELPGYWVMQTVLGGNSSSYVTVVPLKSFADLDKGHPVERALGEEGMSRLMKTSSAWMARIERTVSRFVPDLSFTQGAGGSQP